MVVKRRVKEDSMREEKRVGEGEDGDGDGGGPPDNPERPVAVAPRGTIPQLAPLSLAIRTVDPLFANVGWRLPKTTELTRVRTTGVSLAMRGERVGRELAERDGEAEKRIVGQIGTRQVNIPTIRIKMFTPTFSF
ncbi:hypothetical protein HZH68_008308 [Vespula germanica]|uniref:Uncharacterized protein n=1 Tax=Vespula germanica TaxID=30212 RepID=A0A834K5U6_VESGE|nr:hypothetical protein HZH68_008308 [Vespula germanica]